MSHIEGVELDEPILVTLKLTLIRNGVPDAGIRSVPFHDTGMRTPDCRSGIEFPPE